jgi:hypothetical protein
MPKFRKKPVVVEAVQVRWSTWGEVCDFVGGAISEANPGRNITADEASCTCGEQGPDFIAFDLPTTHGELATFRHGDWVLRDSKPGTFYPCKPDVFALTYEAVDA